MDLSGVMDCQVKITIIIKKNNNTNQEKLVNSGKILMHCASIKTILSQAQYEVLRRCDGHQKVSSREKLE